MKLNANYNCSQPSLYLVAEHGWESFDQYLAVFSSFKSKYTAAYATARKKEISDAQKLPDATMRKKVAESLRIQLSQDNKSCLAVMQLLKRYIADAWAPQFFDVKWSAATGNRYEQAAADNWRQTKQMMIGAIEFITANTAILTTTGFMPATFKDDVAAKKAAFELTLNKFVKAQQEAEKQTNEKITANNTVYAALISMFLDAQELTALDTVRDQFVFDKILRLINPGSPANLKGMVTYMIDGKPVAGVDAMIEEQDLVVKTGANGEYNFEGVKSGDVTVKFVLNGEIKDAETFRIPPSTTVTKDVKIASV